MTHGASVVKPVLSPVEGRELYIFTHWRPVPPRGFRSKVNKWHRPLAGASVVAVLLTLTACGGDGGNAPPPLAPINTLAYVDTACRDGADGTFSATQELRVRRGENPPVTIVRVPMVGPAQVPLSYCGLFGFPRLGNLSLAIGAFQRLGVSPDGTSIVFEVTDDFSRLGQPFVPPEQKGIFFIHADGSGLRRLGDASRIPAISASLGTAEPAFRFSPNGRLVDFTDMGPGPGGEDAAQVFILDVATRQRTQVTHLPPAPFAGIDGSRAFSFLNDRIVFFATTSNPDELNPDAKFLVFTVNIDNIDDGKPKLLSEVLGPGGVLVPVPGITGFGRLVQSLYMPGVPANPMQDFGIVEVFITDGMNVLQLTNFGRTDTSINQPLLSVDGDRVFFTASDDATLGSNPLETCQIFSVDALGGDLRQLTSFGASRHSALGCYAQRPSDGCRTDFNIDQKVSQDKRTGTLVFVSSCDPFGTNPNGQQIFAMRPDGSGLHALTDTHRLVRNEDGSVEAELPGPWSYGPHR